MHKAHAAIVSALVLVLAACGGGKTEDVSATSLDRSPTVTALAAKVRTKVSLPPTTAATVGTPLQLVATVTDQNGKVVSGVTLTWTSSDKTVSTVNTSGLLNP
jgi:ABC-type uncharacterized transport system auxiliary subunit